MNTIYKKNYGYQFEKKLKQIFKQYEKLNLAKIIKIEQLKLKSGAYIEKLPFDFFGYVMKFDGINFDEPKVIAIEAKHVKNGNRIPKSKIKEHQVKELYKVYQNNGYAFLIICSLENKKIYRMKVNDDFLKLYYNSEASVNFTNYNSFPFSNADILGIYE